MNFPTRELLIQEIDKLDEHEQLMWLERIRSSVESPVGVSGKELARLLTAINFTKEEIEGIAQVANHWEEVDDPNLEGLTFDD